MKHYVFSALLFSTLSSAGTLDKIVDMCKSSVDTIICQKTTMACVIAGRKHEQDRYQDCLKDKSKPANQCMLDDGGSMKFDDQLLEECVVK